MSDLTLGGPDIPWSHPSPWYNPSSKKYEHDGMVFYGLDKATQEDLDTLNDYLSGTRPGSVNLEWKDVDHRALVGRYHAKWSNYWYDNDPNVEPHQKPGGLGSDTYERQLVGYGVEFAKEPIWHYDAEGNFIKAIPANMGAYHKYNWPDGYSDLIAGPEPESEAAILLNGGSYGWDDEAQYYIIEE